VARRIVILLPALSVAALASAAVGCQARTQAPTPGPDPHPDSAAAAAIDALHQQHRRAHLTGDADLFVASFADTLIVIDAGEVTRLSRRAARERFQAYFEAVDILSWSDIVRPEIHVSRDGTLAGAIVRKRVRLVPAGSMQGAQEEESTFAWLETWERHDGGWRLTIIASTALPDS